MTGLLPGQISAGKHDFERKYSYLEAILKIKGLKSYYYSGQNVIPAVDGVDLDIYPGEIVGIVGESGCGKSTVVRSLMGLLDPVSSKREADRPFIWGRICFR